MYRLSDLVVLSLDALIEEAKNSVRSKFSFYFVCDRPSISLIYPWETTPNLEFYKTAELNSQMLEIVIQPYKPTQYGAVVFILFCLLLNIYRRGQRRRYLGHRDLDEGPRQNRHVVCRVLGWFGDGLMSTLQCIVSPFSTLRYMWNRKKIRKQQNRLFRQMLSHTTYIPGNADFGQESCTICLEVFQASQELLSLECKHYFHPVCIGNWLKSKEISLMTCPLCHKHVACNLDESARASLREDLFHVYLGSLKNKVLVPPNIEASTQATELTVNISTEAGSSLVTIPDAQTIPQETDSLQPERHRIGERTNEPLSNSPN